MDATVPIRKSGFGTVRSLGLATEHFPNYVNRRKSPHRVDVLLLSFIIRGEATHWMEGRGYREDGVSLGITHYGQPHTIVTGPEGIEIMNIYVDPGRLALPCLPPEPARMLPDILPLHSGFMNRVNRLVRLTFERPERAVELVRGIHSELTEGRPGANDAALTYFKLFLLECCRSALSLGLKPSGAGRHAPDVRMERLRRLLDDGYREEFTLEMLADKAGLNPNYLCRAFKRHTGRSIFEYLAERRLQAAMFALREGDAKVSAVAFESGFRDLSFFNRSFKKALGVTPSEYRRRFI